MKRQIKHGDEQDAFTSWRHLYIYLSRPGVTSAIKRRARRRERHEAKLEIRKSDERHQ